MNTTKRLPKIVTKGWGFERIIANGPEYCCKELFFIKGFRCSFHYHLKKLESFFCASGKILVVHSFDDCLSDERDKIKVSECYANLIDEFHWLSGVYGDYEETAQITILEPGDVIDIPRGLRHAMYGLLDTSIIEVSTEHFDDDSIRILKGD